MSSITSPLDPLMADRRNMVCASVINPQGDYLMLGLTWFALVGSNPRNNIYQLARSLRATHYVLVESNARVAACARLPTINRVRGRSRNAAHCYSLAALFACAHPEGAQACLLPDTQGGAWLMASHEGHVLCSSDRHFASRQAADDAIADIKIRYPGLIQLTLSTEWQHNMPCWLAQKLSASSALKSIPTLHLLPRGSILCGGFVLIGATSLWALTDHTKPIVASTVQGQFELTRQVEVKDELLKVMIDRPGSLWSSIQIWASLPIKKEGWKLISIDCQTTDKDWHCGARYHRDFHPAGREHLEQLGLSNPILTFDNLKEAVVRWRDQRSLEVLDDKFDKGSGWLDQLQRIENGFNSLEVGAVIKRAQGNVRPVRLQGPLRSASLIKTILLPISWRRVSISLNDLPARLAGAKKSAVEFTAEGEIYAD